MPPAERKETEEGSKACDMPRFQGGGSYLLSHRKMVFQNTAQEAGLLSTDRLTTGGNSTLEQSLDEKTRPLGAIKVQRIRKESGGCKKKRDGNNS